MEYAKLGKTDIKIARITFGCWELGGGPWEFTSDETNIRAIQIAYDHGITAFDTAEGYGAGHSEEIVGKALSGKRAECVIASKVSPDHLRTKDVRNAIEGSLKRLKMDFLDIYYIHWPNIEISIEETMSELNKIKKEGLIKSIGVSNFSLEQLQEAQQFGQIDIIQSEYSLLTRNVEDGLIQYCHKNDIGFASYSSLAKGILTGVFHLGKNIIKEDDFRRSRRLFSMNQMEQEMELILLMKDIAESKQIEISQVALVWLLQKKGVSTAIVGTQSENHLLENIQSAGVSLSVEEMNSLDDVSAKVIENL